MSVKHLAYSVLAMLLLCIPRSAPSQESRMVTVTGESYGESKTPEQARREALQQARARASEEAGINIDSQSLGVTIDSSNEWFETFTQLIQSTARARIVQEHIDSTWAEFLPGTTSPVYYVRLTAEIRTEVGQRDPGFQLDVQVNGANASDKNEPILTLQAGEELILTVTPTRDCYLTVFNILPNDTVRVIAPNPYMTETFASANAEFQVPSEGMRKRGIRLRAEAIPDRNEHTEVLLVVATKMQASFHGKILQNTHSALMPINRWLVDIPLDQRVETNIAYRIVR